MSSFVREHYPVASLPRDLRADFPEDGWVRVSVEAVGPGSTVDILGHRLDQDLAEGAADLDAGRACSIDDVKRAILAPAQGPRITAIAELRDRRRLLPSSASDSVDRVRALRDQWDQ